MAKGSKNFYFSAEACIFLAVLGALFAGWVGLGPSNQELLANYAKSKDVWDLILANKGFAWWSPSYLGGAPTAPLAGTALAMFWLVLGGLYTDPIIGGKVLGFIALGLSGLLMAAFVRRLTGDKRAGWIAAFLYALGPQAALRLAGNEHMPVIFCMPYPPLIGWALLEIATRGSGRGMIILAMAVAGMSLTFNKITAVFAPVALGLAVWLHFRFQSKMMPLIKGCLGAAAVWVVLGLLPQLPGLREAGRMTLFSTDPLLGWQSSFSIKAPLSWFDRGGLLLSGMPGNFIVDEGGFYLGLVVIVATAIALEIRRRGTDSPLDSSLRIFLGLFLFVHWFSLGPRSGLGGVGEFLKSAQGIQDWVLPFFWISALGPIIILAQIWPAGRWKWPTFALALGIYLLTPGFRLFELIPLAGTVRAPWSFWQVGGSFCVAAIGGVAVARFCPGKTRFWLPATALILAALDFTPYYAKFFKPRLEQGTYENFVQAADFLRTQDKPGSILPLSGRYFYMRLPELSGRPISTEAFQAYFMSKGMRAVQDAGGSNAETMKVALSLQGVRYIFIDRKDVDTPEQLQIAFKQQYPIVFENQFFTILENPNSLAPGFFARNYVTIPPAKYEFASADLGLLRLYFLPVEVSGVEMSDPALAGLMNPQNGEVELTNAFRDREGQPFRILNPECYQHKSPNLVKIFPNGQSGWIMLTQAWHPDWKVLVDGVKNEVNRVAVAFSGIRIGEGVREVKFVFLPPIWVSISLSLGLLGWVIVLGGCGYLRFGPAPKRWKEWWDGEELEFLEATTRRVEKGVGSTPQKMTRSEKLTKVLVIFPTYNEVEMIQSALDQVLDKSPSVEVLVVDDGSPDGTADKVRQYPRYGKKVHLLARSGKAGLGSAYRAGFKWALERGYDAVVEMDADLSHDPADVPRLLAALTDGADMAVGSRYLNGIRILNWPQSRLWISTFGGWYARCLTGLPMTDPTSGFKAIRRKVLENLDWEKFTAQGYGFQVELHFFTWQSGFKIQEVPIVFTERRQGNSKMSPEIAKEAAVRVLQLALRRIFP
jgi:dolichol-phosphate mannosyltransferase